MASTKKNTDARSRGEWQGMNWIRQEKRLAIYLRDGLSCAYCGHSVEQGAALTLDHVLPHSHGGTNHETNLVTACERCNKSRGNRSMITWSRAVAQYVNHGVTAAQVREHVRDCTSRELPREAAKHLIARRGSAARALANISR